MAKRRKERKQHRKDRPVLLSKSGKPMSELSKKALREYRCSWCDQRLDRLKESPSYCGALNHDSKLPVCHWFDTLNPDLAVKRQWEMA